MCHLLNIKKSITSAYDPEGNGAVERMNRTLKSLLKVFVNPENLRSWDEDVPKCLMAYRASIHSSTGQSPHFFVTGREMRMPSDMLSPYRSPDNLIVSEYVLHLGRRLHRAFVSARDHLQTAHRRQKEYYDRKAYGTPFQAGDLVWLHSEVPAPGIPAKFHREWTGPFIVHELISDCTCTIQSSKDDRSPPRVVHFNRLKPAMAQGVSGGVPDVAEECVVPEEGGSAVALRTMPTRGGGDVPEH